ncbi:putative TIR domain-containing protein [Helianthus debilis subsp. tardiflorus]
MAFYAFIYTLSLHELTSLSTKFESTTNLLISMASTSPATRTFRFDVFLSFRGEDTRRTFTDHLYHALLLRTFRDNEIDRGQVLEPAIKTAITESKGSIVVLSKNYAESRWCLEELRWILEQWRKCGHFVFPVFYYVEPSDVRSQRGSFAIEESKWTMDNVWQWKAALREVGNLTGRVLSRYI